MCAVRWTPKIFLSKVDWLKFFAYITPLQNSSNIQEIISPTKHLHFKTTTIPTKYPDKVSPPFIEIHQTTLPKAMYDIASPSLDYREVFFLGQSPEFYESLTPPAVLQ